MSASNAPDTKPFQPFSASPSSNSGWLPVLIFNAKAITAAAEALPFPYVKGVFGMAVFLLETVEKVQKNRDDMKELCADTVDIITVIRDRISFHRDTAALQFKAQCEGLEGVLKDVVEVVQQRQMKPRGFSARFKDIVKSSSLSDEISKFRERIREVRSNFMLMTTIDTNFGVQKVFTFISPDMLVPQVTEPINSCPSPTRVFQGRQTILHELHQYFTENGGKQNIFVLHGLGGAGKTQIALKFIEQSTSNFTDIFFIDTSTTETIDAGLKRIATTKSVGDSSEDALQWLRSKADQWLLFFDNADNPKINLNDYLPQCSHGNILITSRNPGLCVYAGAHSPVADMEETDAVNLLLKSAAQDSTAHMKETAAQIVKILHYLPLAIIQAGAFISKSGNLSGYLALYAQNRAQLLTQSPTQAHDNYAWTVYTTWQISFDQLKEQAKTLLQLCSFLHNYGISENIFKNATNYTLQPAGPSKEELEAPLKVLSHFLGPSGDWDPFCFTDAIIELRSYSLINFNVHQNMFSIHPLVHDWTRSTLCDKGFHHCMIAIAGMSLARLSEQDMELASLWMLPHIDFLMRDNPKIIPDFRHEFGKVYVLAAKPGKAQELELEVLEKRRNILGNEHLDTLEAMYWLAWIYRDQGKLIEAEELERIVLKKRKEILGDNHPDTLKIMANLAATYYYLGKLKEAEELQVVVLEKRRHILGDEHQVTLTTVGDVASTYRARGKWQEAAVLELSVLEKRRHVLGDDHQDTLRAMGNLAVTYRCLGKLKDAEELQTAVLQKRRVILGDNHPDTFRTMGNLAQIYLNLGQLKEAEELELIVLKKRRSILGDNHHDTLNSMGNLAHIYTTLGKLKDAEMLTVELLEKRRKIQGDNHESTLLTMGNLAVTYTKLGYLQKAEELQLEVLEKYRRAVGDDNLSTLLAMGNLATTYNKLGRLKEAEELEVVVLKQWQNILGNNHPSTLRTMSNLGSTLNKLERWHEAEELLVEALKKQTNLHSEKHPFTCDTMQRLVVTYTKLGKLQEVEDLNTALKRSQA
ncbi:hypothetical protein FB451DRAFT_1363568 [Mycena latifolia]|nr:hypothetical protein FB451DRAFT_1363568 [Mycena latifolia]